MSILLGSLPWCFNKESHANVAAMIAAVEAYGMRILKRPPDWEPHKLVVSDTTIKLRYEAVRDGAYDSAFTTLTTDHAHGFTAAELLWRTHEALLEDELADHCFFEGFSRVRAGFYAVHQGS